MLKKIVKYGNSNALVVDRAILELLNMGEGSVVKLSTDGKSLIVTPEQTLKEERVSLSGVEKVQEYVQDFKNAAEAIKQPEQFTSTEQYVHFQEAAKEIMAKYTHAFTGYDHQAFLEEIDRVAEEKYQGTKTSPEFIAAVKAIQVTYSPELALMHQELAETAKKFGY
ncbi:hypothetical protein H0W26_04125 [Candidatus Dependentiae bacterium]|nr:hypothetical protein [Candidatus Dependentiae bacterium]